MYPPGGHLAVSELEQLVLPRLRLPPRQLKSENETDTLIEKYTDFLRTRKGLNWTEAQVAQAVVTDINSVTRVAPSVQDHVESRLIMVAWFRTLFEVDDLVEEAPEEARVELCNQCSLLFRGETVDVPSAIAHGSVFHRAEMLCQAFITLCRDLLNSTQERALFHSIAAVWQAMSDSQTFKQGRDFDQTLYLEMRSLTVGVQPFLLMLSFDLPWRSANADGVASDSAMLQMQELTAMICRIVGLQNDIIGWERDQETAENCNLVLLRSACQRDPSIITALNSTVRLHNETVTNAVSIWEELCFVEDASLQVYKDLVIGFVEAHARWAAKANRWASTHEMPETTASSKISLPLNAKI